MKTIGLWLTRSGKEAVRLKETTHANGRKTYSWMGAYGAGSGESLEIYQAMVEQFKITKRGMQTVQEPTTA